MGYPSDVSDQEWAFCAPYLALMKEDAPQRDHSMRSIFNALRYMVRAGCPWHMIPNDLSHQGYTGAEPAEQAADLDKPYMTFHFSSQPPVAWMGTRLFGDLTQMAIPEIGSGVALGKLSRA